MNNPIKMWAAIIQLKNSEWIDPLTVRVLKKKETIEMSKVWDYNKQSVRFARIEIKEIV